jgi:hypothetical protein
VKLQKRALEDAEYAALDNGAGRERLKLYEEKKPYREEFRAVAPPPREVKR